MHVGVGAAATHLGSAAGAASSLAGRNPKFQVPVVAPAVTWPRNSAAFQAARGSACIAAPYIQITSAATGSTATIVS